MAYLHGIFLTVNLLNNQAFKYKISLPLHIILRSAGPVTSMFVGYLFGRRYTKTQIFAVFLLFSGVVLAAFADAQAKGSKITLFEESSESIVGELINHNTSLIGFVTLFLALLLSAVMGVYTDRTYARYGRNHWGENLFYSHALSLPVFLYHYPSLRLEFTSMLSSPPLAYFSTNSTTPLAKTPHAAFKVSTIGALLPSSILGLPSQPFFLALNALTQYVCIRGVNLLSAHSSSLTGVIVLNVRKLVSLILSIWLFGNKLPPGVTLGAVVVFIGAGLYAIPRSKVVTGRTTNAQTRVLENREKKAKSF